MSDTPVAFSDLDLPSSLLKSITELGYETPSPIQAECIPLLLNGQDVLGMAQTGTGKTAAFALPLLSRIDLKSNKPQVLVLAPTRELAVQVAEAFQVYARHMPGFHVLPIYGGQSYTLQLKQLRRGPHVVVGTPGRVMDHLDRGTLKIDELKAMVLDEADEMLRMGFIDDVETIMAKTPATRQTALFSATMPEQIRRITKRYMREPTEVKIASKTTTMENIDQKCWIVSGTNKLDALVRILETDDFGGIIIFARTKTATTELAEKLEARGYAAAALNGDMNQQLRERTVQRLKDAKLDILVATDVAARGLDVQRVGLVVNYDIPYDTEAYVHRIGRTGRAGRDGKAIMFVAPRERRLLKQIERATRQPIQQMDLPSRDLVQNKRLESFREQVSNIVSKEDIAPYRELVDQLAVDTELEVLDLASALLYMAQKEKPLILPPEPEPRPRREREDRDSDRGEKRERINYEDLDVYRLEVGRSDGVQVKNIVGAIANEADINSRHIGDIRLHDDYSTVQLPKGMPTEVLQQLKGVFICRKKIDITLMEGEIARPAPRSNKPRGEYKGKGRNDRGGNDRGAPRKPRPRRDD
ncbi:DEAD/DEAH box helicase [Amphritea sp.]|uniref:DEAD/DEAH box helicase n=1 Tax=Amphritea sp. TaxID=1872502 RepID=UPI0025BB2168|nr:DEAD/DEAH box helicase [Amphritea sp.]